MRKYQKTSFMEGRAPSSASASVARTRRGLTPTGEAPPGFLRGPMESRGAHRRERHVVRRRAAVWYDLDPADVVFSDEWRDGLRRSRRPRLGPSLRGRMQPCCPPPPRCLTIQRRLRCRSSSKARRARPVSASSKRWWRTSPGRSAREARGSPSSCPCSVDSRPWPSGSGENGSSTTKSASTERLARWFSITADYSTTPTASSSSTRRRGTSGGWEPSATWGCRSPTWTEPSWAIWPSWTPRPCPRILPSCRPSSSSRRACRNSALPSER